jgi:Glycosyl hydrolase family 66
MDQAYESFIAAVRQARPGDVISFNQVNGVPAGIAAPSRPGFRYVEVWPPNDRWRHLESLMSRSAGPAARQGDTLAIYPPVWEQDRISGLHTVVLTEAIATAFGIGTLIWGDARGALRHPYYVNHERLAEDEGAIALQWHRFTLRCRDLFRAGEDTSWYELDDENAAVTVAATVPAKPEPLGGSLFARVRHSQGAIVVSMIDLSGSRDGSWSEGTTAGSCAAARVSALVEQPERWSASVAVLGRNGGRFAPVELEVGSHREGRAVTCDVPIIEGWSVLRLENKER